MTMGNKLLHKLAGASCLAIAFAQPAFAQQATPEAAPQTMPPAAPEVLQTPVSDPNQVPVEPDQTSETPAADGLGDIVVTARRRDENLQDVPISITAFDAGALTRLGIQDTTDLEAYVPSLSIGNEAIFSVYPNYGIRGQRNDSFLLQQSPTVITYFAGAPQGHPAGFGNTLFDIASVQVLNGPQGTLFGKNSTGGAVVVDPNRPTRNLEGEVYASYGSYDTFIAGGVVNIPMLDTLALRIAGEHRQTNSYGLNRATGQHLGADNSNAVRASLLWEPTPSLSVLTIGDYYGSDGAPGVARLAFVNATPAGQPGGSQLGGRPALLAQVQAEFALQQSQRGNDRYEIASGFGTGTAADVYGRPSEVKVENWGVTSDITLKLSDTVKLRNIASYRSIKTAYDTDYASGNYLITSPASNQNLEQYTEELQLLGQAFDDRLDYVVGAFYFNEEGVDDILALNYLSRRYNIFDGINRSYSFFAQGTFALTDNLKVTAGVRYNNDYAQAANRSRNLAANSPLYPESARTYSSCGVGSLNASGALVPYSLAACALEGEVSYERATWTGSLEYTIPTGTISSLDRGLLYATARRGYRAGGFNARATTAQTFIPYAPETVDDYEIGVKADWDFSGVRLRTNLAMFYDNYSDLQRQISIPVAGVPIPQGTISNAASARVYGLEFEWRLIPFRNFEIGGYYNYIKAKYVDYLTLNSRGETVDLSDDPFTRTPSNKFSVNGRYTIDLPDNSDIALSAAYSWRDDEIFEETPLPNGVVPTQEAFGLLTARVEWSNIGGSAFDLAVYGRNLTNEYYATGFADISTSLGVAVFLPGEPRTFGIQGRFAF